MSSFKSSHENEKTIRRANIDFVNNFFHRINNLIVKLKR